MIQLTYQELYRINPLEARKILLSTFEQREGNFLRTAKTLGCSRNRVKKFVHLPPTMRNSISPPSNPSFPASCARLYLGSGALHRWSRSVGVLVKRKALLYDYALLWAMHR